MAYNPENDPYIAEEAKLATMEAQSGHAATANTHATSYDDDSHSDMSDADEDEAAITELPNGSVPHSSVKTTAQLSAVDKVRIIAV